MSFKVYHLFNWLKLSQSLKKERKEGRNQYYYVLYMDMTYA